MQAAISKLTRLGLTGYEAKAYIALLKENPATAYEIAKISGIPTSKIYEVINKLISKEMVQSIHGERSKMFIPVSPEEFVTGFRRSMNDNLREVEEALQGVKTGLDTSYTWHIKDYRSFIQRGRRMIDTARDTILLMVWAQEMNALATELLEAEDRGTKVAVVHYGATNLKIARLYRHPVEATIYSERETRGFTLIADSKEVLTCKIDEPEEVEAIWSMNEGLVMLAEDYIRHDIYFMKIAKRFNPMLKEKFGERFEKLRDLYSDESILD